MTLHRDSRGLVTLLREDAVGCARTAIAARSMTGDASAPTSGAHYDGRVTAFCIALSYLIGENVSAIESGVYAEAREDLARNAVA